MSNLGSPENPTSSPTRLSSHGDSRGRGDSLASTAISLGMSGTSSGTVKQGKAGSSIRDQAIEKYLALIKHKRELQRKNQKIQTKIAQHLRKNKIEFTSSLPAGQAQSEEEEKYSKLLQELAYITETREHENTEFEQELNDIQGKKKKTDREIRNIENYFESTKTKIIKTAKDSQTASPISMEAMHEINKRLAEKESELRLLRLNQIKTREKLQTLEDLHRPKTVDKSQSKREELNLENKVYSDKLEEGEDKMASLRHKIAGDVVMLSHLAMKLYYVKMDTEQLGTEDQHLTDKLDNLKSEIIALKSEKMQLMADKEELSERAGMIANTVLLGDFKDTTEEFEKKINSNAKLDTKLKNFYYNR
jgi:chromosome segregation ATPase